MDNVNRAKKSLDDCIKNNWEDTSTSDEQFTYVPYSDDPRDVAFAEKYNSHDEIRKYPMRQIVLLDESTPTKHLADEHED